MPQVLDPIVFADAFDDDELLSEDIFSLEEDDYEQLD